MEQKSKFIVIGLAGFALICLFLFIQAVSTKESLVQENQSLKNELATVSNKLKRMEGEINSSRNRISSLTADLERAVQEKRDIEGQIESLQREREELVDRLKRRPEPQPEPQIIQQAAPQAADAYWAGILKSKTSLELQLENLRNELRNAQTTNERLAREKSSLELELTNLNNDREELRRQLEYNQKVTDGITQEIVRERNDKMKMSNNLKSIKGENTVLMRQVKTLDSRKSELEKRVESLQQENAAFQKRFTEMEAMLTDRLTQIDALKNKLDDASAAGAGEAAGKEKKDGPVELAPIVVRPQPEKAQKALQGQEEPSSSEALGKILAVNRDNNFVVINLGRDAGINTGDVFKITRDDKDIGRIEVIQVRREISACDIKSENVPIKIGDKVR